MTKVRTVWWPGAAAALLLAGIQPAAADEMKGLYFGVGAGRVNYEVTASDEVESFTLDDHNSGWKGFVGWQFNKWLGLEVTYFDGGSVELSPDTSILSVRLATDALMAHATGTYWLSEYFGFHGRAGIASLGFRSQPERWLHGRAGVRRRGGFRVGRRRLVDL